MSSEHLWEDTGIFPNFLAKHTTDTSLAPPSQNSEHLMNVTGIDPDFISQHTTDVRLLNSPQDKVKSSGPVVSGCNGNSASLQKTHHCGSGNKNHMHEEARKIKVRGKKEMTKESKRKQSRQEAREREKERNRREQRERCIQGERTPIQESSACQESSGCQCHCIPGMGNIMFNCSDCGMHRIQCNKSSHCCVGMHLKGGLKLECNKCCICLEGGCNACLLLCFCHTVHKQCALSMIVNSI